MEDLYLRFPDQGKAEEILQDYQGSVDVIGEIEGTQGWHVNTRGPAPDSLKAFAMEVSSPFRVWA